MQAQGKNRQVQLPPEIERWYEGKVFTSDWTSPRIPGWISLLSPFAGSSPSILEIGSWEGRSAIFFLEFLKPSRMVCIDTFQGGEEHQEDRAADLRTLEERFDNNIAAYSDRVEKLAMRSVIALDQLVQQQQQFDIIYIDGSHQMDEALVDSIMSWRLLKVGGVAIWDDYQWSPGMTRALDIFLAYRAGEYQPLHRGWQIAVRRTAPSLAKYERRRN